jgi:hypothetical protein
MRCDHTGEPGSAVRKMRPVKKNASCRLLRQLGRDNGDVMLHSVDHGPCPAEVRHGQCKAWNHGLRLSFMHKCYATGDGEAVSGGARK